jgi:hypothetical protein
MMLGIMAMFRGMQKLAVDVIMQSQSLVVVTYGHGTRQEHVIYVAGRNMLVETTMIALPLGIEVRFAAGGTETRVLSLFWSS